MPGINEHICHLILEWHVTSGIRWAKWTRLDSDSGWYPTSYYLRDSVSVNNNTDPSNIRMASEYSGKAGGEWIEKMTSWWAWDGKDARFIILWLRLVGDWCRHLRCGFAAAGAPQTWQCIINDGLGVFRGEEAAGSSSQRRAAAVSRPAAVACKPPPSAVLLLHC